MISKKHQIGVFFSLDTYALQRDSCFIAFNNNDITK